MNLILPNRENSKKWNSLFYFILSCTFFMAENTHAQQICGIVLDEISREPLIGASVYTPLNQNGTSTDNNGYFCLPIPDTTTVAFQVSYIGYKKYLTLVSSRPSDSLLVILLTPGVAIDEITVVENSQISNTGGVIDVPLQLVKKLPNILGEPDLLKSFQLMPGVKMGDEGSSVFYVRGGTPDQNLTLLDDVPLYYVNHIGGFLSVFDISTIKKATFYKGYFPPRYGGRLSSVLDIRLKDGNIQKTQKEFSLGTLASKFFIEGPIIENKLSGMISVRRCNIDLFLRPLTTMSSNGKEVSSYTFYDLTSKLTYSKNPENKFNLMIYSGMDKLFFKEKDNISYYNSLKNKWGNLAGALKWIHFSSGNWVTSTGIKFSKFYRIYASKEVIHADNASYTSKGSFCSKIGDLIFYSEGSKSFGSFDFRTGIESTIHKFTPSAIHSNEQNSVQISDTLYSNQLNTLELKAYAEGEWKINDRLNISSGFYTIYWKGTDNISFDPRIALNYSLPRNSTLKASYSINHQFIHLLSNNSGGFPVDLWIPSSSNIPPERSEQITLGYAKKIKVVRLSAEAYYKKMTNLIYYKPGLNVFNTLKWEDAIEQQGQGYSKGIELLAEKTSGKHTGWIGYTLSKDTRVFEILNSGNTFPFKYGRLHEINLVYSAELSEDISFSANWVFASGNHITLATQSFPVIDFNPYNENYFGTTFREGHYYGGVNNFKTASYHRLDIGFNFKKQLEKSERNIYLGFYNLYNRKNPYYYYFKTKNGNRNLFQYSIFPIIPSVSFTYNW